MFLEGDTQARVRAPAQEAGRSPPPAGPRGQPPAVTALCSTVSMSRACVGPWPSRLPVLGPRNRGGSECPEQAASCSTSRRARGEVCGLGLAGQCVCRGRILCAPWRRRNGVVWEWSPHLKKEEKGCIAVPLPLLGTPHRTLLGVTPFRPAQPSHSPCFLGGPGPRAPILTEPQTGDAQARLTQVPEKQTL